jgi:hypothetical protein
VLTARCTPNGVDGSVNLEAVLTDLQFIDLEITDRKEFLIDAG